MATIAADRSASTASHLPQIRQMEATAFRSWPSARTVFDGTWAVRLTASLPAKRLNSINPLDPADSSNFERRMARTRRLFDAINRPLVFRLSPLAPPMLEKHLEADGWQRFDETRVMRAPLASFDLSQATNRIPLRDVGTWLDAVIAMGGVAADAKPGIAELISRIEGESALFLETTADGQGASAALAVRLGTMVGLFEVVTDPRARGRGHGRSVMRSALLWARQHRATTAWLQVVADSAPANGLYGSLGFREAYRYAYWAQGKTNDG